jgi:hypothetical protein
MKICFFVMLFFVLAVGTVSSQETRDKEKFEQQEYEQDWVVVETATSRLFNNQLDRNFYYLPNKNVEYWKSTSYNGYITLDLYEVDCVGKQKRLLKSIRNTRDGRKVVTGDSWEGITDDSSNSQVATIVCRSIKPTAIKKSVSRKVTVKRSRKRP